MILILKLLPFTKEYAIKRPKTIMLEDKALAYNYYIQH
jgi:hypothetical protein